MTPNKEWMEQKKLEASKWAYELLKEPFVVLDTETASMNGEIVQIAIIDQDGKELMNQLIKPKGPIDPEAENVHHISMETVKDSPTWDMVYEKVKGILEGKKVIAYNAGYDKPVLAHTCKVYGLPEINANWDCAMLKYAEFYNEWSSYRGSFKWHKLTVAIESFKLKVDRAHDALGDILMTLEVIQAMSKHYINVTLPKVELY